MSKRIIHTIIGLALTAGVAAVDWNVLGAAVVGHAADIAGRVVAAGPLLDTSG